MMMRGGRKWRVTVVVVEVAQEGGYCDDYDDDHVGVDVWF